VSAFIPYDSVARISATTSKIEGTTAALRSSADHDTAEIAFGNSLIVDGECAWYQHGASAAILSAGNNQLSGNRGSFRVKTPLTPK
jgi:hypothetical protein